MKPEQTQQPDSNDSGTRESEDSKITTADSTHAATTGAIAGDGHKSFRAHNKKRKALLIFGAILALLLSGALGGYVEYRRLGSKNQSNASTASIDNSTANQIKDKKAADSPVTLADNTYLSKPKILADLKFFKHPDQLSSEALQYFQIGTTKDNKKIVVVYYIPQGIGGPQDYVAVENSDGSYGIVVSLDSYLSGILAKPDQTNALALQDFKDNLSSNVKFNASIKLPELTFPPDTTLNKQALTANVYSKEFLPGGIDDLGNKTPALTKFGEDNGVTFYKSTKDNTTFDSVLIYATVKNMYLTTYKLSGPVISAVDTLAATWTAGENNNSTYFSAAAGCGSLGSYIIAKSVDKSQLKQVGTADGKALYQLPLTTPLVKELYDQDYNKGEYLTDTALQNLTLQQFTDKHAYFLFQNEFGEYNVVQRGDMFVRGGCAKPVIYLYPVQPTQVSVQVGADVTKSVPYYPLLGWHNVLAMPNGSLLYQGVSYSSLFWEGFGHGQYPSITTGTIVPSDQAIKTIRTQLYAQGLNQKETNDFIAFWTPKLPKTQYVRISWLTKFQIDELAPLSIKPKPASVIRVFMDVSGLAEPGALPAPALSPIARTGFTAVEWGGLVRDGSVSTLR